MPTAHNDGVELYYETSGSGHTVCFIADLGCGPWLWGWQAPAVAGQYESLVWDLRGTGQSTAGEEYEIETLAADLEAVLSAHGARRVTIVGAGMGGMVALEHARSYARADGLVLLGTTATGSQFETGAFLGPSADLEGLLSEEFREAYPREVERIAAWREQEDADRSVKRGQADAVGSFDVSDRLYELTVPALVCHGAADEVVPAAAGERLADELPKGSLETFDDGSHFFFIEQARLCTDAVAAFLDERR